MSAKCDFRFDWGWASDPPDWKSDWLTRLTQRFKELGPQATRMATTVAGGSVKLEAEGEVWNVVTDSKEFAGTIGGTQTGWVAVGRGAGFAGEMASSKCDWRVRNEVLDAFGTRGTQSAVGLRVGPGAAGGRIRIGSAKCDWRVGVDDGRQIAEMQSRNGVSDVVVQSDRMSGKITVRESEWRMSTSLGAPNAFSPPTITAAATAKAGHYSCTIGVNTPKGPAVRLRVVSSDKCDFRIESMEFSDDGVGYRALSLPAGEPPKSGGSKP